jgi:hypothetical protein
MIRALQAAPAKATKRALAACLVLVPCLCISIPARAQSEIVPKEVQDIFADVSDIDKLRILNPMKFSGEQLDKIIAVLKKAQTDYNSKLREAAVPPIKDMAKEVRAVRQKMLETHSAVPKDFDEKVKKVQSDFTKRRDTEDANTLKSVSDSIRAILTQDQIDKGVAVAKRFAEVDGKPTMKGADEKFFNLYVLGTFIVYPRIVPLLEDMRKFAEPSASASSTRLRANSTRPGHNSNGIKVALLGRNR